MEDGLEVRVVPGYVDMPKGAKLLCVQVQKGKPCIWAEVDPNAKPVPRKLAIVGTGHTLPPDGKYLGTFQVHDGDLVFHVFDFGEGI